MTMVLCDSPADCKTVLHYGNIGPCGMHFTREALSWDVTMQRWMIS